MMPRWLQPDILSVWIPLRYTKSALLISFLPEIFAYLAFGFASLHSLRGPFITISSDPLDASLTSSSKSLLVNFNLPLFSSFKYPSIPSPTLCAPCKMDITFCGPLFVLL